MNFESVKIICHKIEDLMFSEIDTSIKIKTEVILKFLDSIKDYFYLFTKDGALAIWDKSVIATDLIPKLAELGIELYTNDQ